MLMIVNFRTKAQLTKNTTHLRNHSAVTPQSETLQSRFEDPFGNLTDPNLPGHVLDMSIPECVARILVIGVSLVRGWDIVLLELPNLIFERAWVLAS